MNLKTGSSSKPGVRPHNQFGRSAKVSSHEKYKNLEPMLEEFLDHFEAIFGNFLVSRGPLGASWAVLGGFLGPFSIFGRFWRPLGAALGSHVAPKSAS